MQNTTNTTNTTTKQQHKRESYNKAQEFMDKYEKAIIRATELAYEDKTIENSLYENWTKPMAIEATREFIKILHKDPSNGAYKKATTVAYHMKREYNTKLMGACNYVYSLAQWLYIGIKKWYNEEPIIVFLNGSYKRIELVDQSNIIPDEPQAASSSFTYKSNSIFNFNYKKLITTQYIWKKLPNELYCGDKLYGNFEPQAGSKYRFSYFDDSCRIYSIGYKIANQADDFRKASILNTTPEQLTDRGEHWHRIAYSNAIGGDKLDWNDRVALADKDLSKNHNIRYFKNLMLKDEEGTTAYKLYHENSKYYSSMIGLDATSSQTQIMSIMSNDIEGMKLSNVISDRREDMYSSINEEVRKVCGSTYSRKQTKRGIMTHGYYSIKEPQKVFGKDYNSFINIYSEMLPGNQLVMDKLNECYQNILESHEDQSYIELDIMGDTIVLEPHTMVQGAWEWQGNFYQQQFFLESLNKNWRGFAARVIHAIDGWIERRVSDLCDFDIALNHDCFYCHPNNMDSLRYNYVRAMKELQESNLMDSICSQFGVDWEPLSGEKYEIPYVDSYIIC